MATMEDVYKFFKEEAPTYYLATMDGDQPRVRPFGTIDLYEGKLYIQTGKVKDVYKQILANPKVEVCGCKGADWWRITGELVADDRTEAKKHMLDAYPALRKFYDENDDNTIVLYFAPGTTCKFESLAGKPSETVVL